MALALPKQALAQDIAVGDAIVTQFSGTTATPDGTLMLDPEGAVAQAIGLGNPGAAPSGTPWRDAPRGLQITADQIGQVFGIAIDDESPANIYLTASSAFGLHWDEATGTWVPGQWGPDGDPGTIYKLNASNGYQPEVFAHVTLGGRVNTGAGLGNISFDSASRQFYVSDLESGLITRLDLEGNILDQFDHGVTGRQQFLNVETGEQESLPEVAFDPSSAAQIEDCAEGAFANTPECWNVADHRRRIWGLATHAAPVDGQNRLYYAVWGSQALGSDDWGEDFAEQQNSIWSVGLASDGSFLPGDVRREFAIPGFSATAEDYARIGGSHPVTDIAFSADGEMALAERGGLRNLGLENDNPFASPDESRVLRARQGEDGVWVPIGRHDVSWYDRKNEGQPHLRAAASGGVDFGYGYTPEGTLDPSLNDDFIWSSGDNLCREESPCAGADGATVLNGLQGQAADTIADLNPDAAFAAYPDSGPATPPDGPSASYFVETGEDEDPNWTGDIEIYKTPAVPGAPDLAVQKTMPEVCIRGGICTGNIEISNVGGGTWTGPIFMRDYTAPTALGFTAVSPPWQCVPIGGESFCYHPPITLKPGESVSLIMDMPIANNFGHSNVTNCAAIDWPLADPSVPANIVAAVQKALTLLGYNPGPIDGAMGPLTSAAIAQAQTDFGLTVNGVIDAPLIDVLFSGSAAWPGDANPDNDEACDSSDIVGTPPPGGVHLPVGSRPGHLAPGSIHQPIGSNPAHVFPNSVHLPIGSAPAHVFPNSIHLPIGSNPGHLFPNSIHLPIGSNPGHLFPNSIHLPIGSNPGHLFPNSIHFPIGSNPGHLFPNSIHLPIGSNPGHNFPQSIHFPIGSNLGHNFPQSIHVPIGSNPGHNFPQSIHLPIGSNPGHNFPQSIHLPIGSNPGHNLPQSIHLPIGSNPGHNFPQSIHLPIGSNPGHNFPQSIHLPIGSNPGHNFPQSIHLPIGSNPGHNFPQSVHLPIGSNPGHNFPQSVHLPIGSNPGHNFPQSIHFPIGSNPGHNFPQSVHLPIGSNGGHQFPQSVHLPIGSNPGHNFPQSLHLPIGSNGGHQFPQSIHLPIGSNQGHQFPQSLHLPIGSNGGHQFPQSIHLPIGSNLQHNPAASIHVPIGSNGGHQFPQSLHVPLGSAGHQPVGSLHLPVGSRVNPNLPVAPKPPLHLPVGSKPQVHLPVGSKPQVHLPVGSKPQVTQPVAPKPEVHRPVGSKPQVHLPVGSKPQVHRPVGSRPQLHLPIGSKPQLHLPVGSKPQVHRPVGSKPQVHRPRGSKPQVHRPVGSKPQVHQPVGSKPQVHRPVGSKLQLHLPIGSKPKVHQPVGSKPRVIQPRDSTRTQPARRVHQPKGSTQQPTRRREQPAQNPVLQLAPQILNNLRNRQD